MGTAHCAHFGKSSFFRDRALYISFSLRRRVLIKTYVNSVQGLWYYKINKTRLLCIYRWAFPAVSTSELIYLDPQFAKDQDAGHQGKPNKPELISVVPSTNNIPTSLISTLMLMNSKSWAKKRRRKKKSQVNSIECKIRGKACSRCVGSRKEKKKESGNRNKK